MLDRKLISALNAGLSQLKELATEWKDRLANLPEAEWSRMRSLDFQDALRIQEALVRKLDTYDCVHDPEFEEKVQYTLQYCIIDIKLTNYPVQYKIVHGEKRLKQRIATLRLAISDENLELLPDYEQRVDVLKELQHIDEHSTVLLKGRVACEVRLATLRFH